jgi:hypothetical protein
MEDFLLNMGITTVLTAIRQSVKNPAKKEQLKRALLKIRNAINALYFDDPDFAS